MTPISEPQLATEWQAWFANEHQDLLRWMSPESVWRKVHIAAGMVAQALHRREPWRLVKEPSLLAEPLRWIFEFATRLGFDLVTATWEKYPATCPYCITESEVRNLQLTDELRNPDGSVFVVHRCTCVGDAVEMADGGLLTALCRRASPQTLTLGEVQAMFANIYAHKHEGDLNRLGFHFMEELAEVDQEIERKDLVECRHEVADVTSWILSLASAAETTLNTRVDVDHLLRATYLPSSSESATADP